MNKGMEIPSKFIYSSTDKKPDMQKQLGCMNGIFQLFDRYHFLGRRASDQNLKKLPPGQSAHHGIELSNAADKTPAQPINLKDIATARVPVESSRTSFSSCSSSIFSSIDCKTTQPDTSSLSQSISPDTPSRILPTKQPNSSSNVGSPLLDFRDVVKDSMYREARGVSVKTVAKHEGKSHVMKHIDSPRPTLRWNSKEEKSSSLPLAAPRFSYDERESRHKLKSNVKLKELPRLSLDSRVRSIKSSASESRSNYLSQGQNGNSSEMLNTNQEPGSNKRPSSIVAKLMGLEALPDSVSSDEGKSCGEVFDTVPRPSRVGDVSKEKQLFESPRVLIKDHASPQLGKANSAMKPTSSSRFPLEPAPWSQFKNTEPPTKTQNSPPSVYGEIAKRLTELEFKKSGKDLRALKQILEAMQKTRAGLEPKKEEETSTVKSQTRQCSPNLKLPTQQSQQSNRPISPTVKGMRSPKRSGSAIVIMKPVKVIQKSSDYSNVTLRNNHLKDPSSGSLAYVDKKTKARTVRSSICSKGPQHMGENPAGLRRISGTVSPKLQQKKHEQSHLTNPSLDLTRAKRQPSKQPLDTTRKPKSKSTTSQVKTEVTSLDHTTAIKNFAVRLSEDRSMAELAITNMEQPSPVSVLDATFYGEDSPSPVKKISYAFKDYETPDCNEEELNAVDIDDLQSSTRANLNSKFDTNKLGDFTHSVHKLLNSPCKEATLCESTTPDHRYITEILLASGLLQDLGSTITTMQLHPSGHFINPDLFHILEKIKGNTELSNEKRHKKIGRSNYNAKIQRKLVFDTVNEILVRKLILPGFSELWIFHNKPVGRVPSVEKLMRELFSEIDHINANRHCSIDDEDDGLTSILSADMMNRSDDWGNYRGEVPGVVLDIERLIFKDLISEIVSGGALVL